MTPRERLRRIIARSAIPIDPETRVIFERSGVEALIDAGLRVEHCQKPTIDPVTGEWVTRPTTITKDAEGRIVAEVMED